MKNHNNLTKKYKFINFSDCVKGILYTNIFVELGPFPESLVTLKIDNCKITNEDLKCLPPILMELHCVGNQITKLDNLPLGLKNLVCKNNKLSHLDYLPLTLENLDCSYNEILSLDNLLKGLVYLECSYNLITKLDSLPNSLVEIYAKSNKIDYISHLPKNLTRANFTDNTLIATPKCSNSLILLNYSLDSEKASMKDKLVQSGYKFAYGSYHTVKYTGYGIGLGVAFGLFGLGYAVTYPFLKK